MNKPKNKDAEIPFEHVGGVGASIIASSGYGEYVGQGFEEHTREDYAVPFLSIIQPLSPIIETKAEARPGMLFNTVTQDLYDAKTGVGFVPVKTQHVFVEWKTRNLGGGFVAQHQLGDPIIEKARTEQEFGKWKVIKGDANSNDLIETYYVYGLLIPESGIPEQMIIAFTSTKIRQYKNWMTRTTGLKIKTPDGRLEKLPLFANRYRITSVSEKNAKGTFFNYHINFDGKTAADCQLPPNDATFLEAANFFKLLQSGKVKAANETQVQTTEEEAEVPFK